jgi:hypothetical protein
VFSGAPPYGKITATATDAGFNTSEFSEAYSLPVGPRLPATTISYQGQVTPIGGTFNTFGPAAVPSTSGNVVFWATINGLPLIPHGIFSSPAGGPITKLVAVGDATPLGGTFSSIGASPVNNELGKVAFWAAVSGGSASEGIFLWSPAGGGTITKIVASGESTPIGGTAYVSFQPPAGSPVAVLNNGGDISFWASVASCCGVYEGVFLYSAAGGTVSKVAATGDPTPAGGTFSTFLSPGFYATIPIVTDQQKVAFRGIISGGPASGVFLASGATLTTVAAAGGSTPLGGTYTSFGRAPSPNESGEVAFWATMSGSSAGICVNGVPCAAFLRNSGGTVSKIIAGGDSGPAGVGGTISDLASAPFMNDSGQVSVWAAVSGGFSSQALVRYTPGEALANVAAVGNSIPAPISSTFDTFVQGGFATSPIPNNLGQVAFWGHGSEGIFLTDPPPPGPVITQGPVQGATAPGTDGGEFGSMFDLDIDNNGEAVFANTVIGGDSGVTSGIFAFFAGTAVRDVALEGDSAPEGGQFDNFFPPYSNDNGTIVARAETVSPNGEGLYAFFAGSPDDAIAVPGDVIPGQGGGTIASSGFSDPSINNAGYVAARATLTGGQQGLYIFFAGSPFKVFKSGETAPGGGGNFSTFGRPALSDFNDVAVKATLSPPGQGLYAFFAGVPQKLARTNDTADANNRVFTDFSDPVLNIDQAVAFTATFTEGGGPSQKGLFAFFAGSPTAQLIADNDPVSPAPSVPPSGGGQFTGFFSPAMTDGTSPVVVARATITGGSASEGLFVFFAGSVVKLVGQGDLITDTSDPDDAFGLPAPVFPYHAINNGRKVVFVANVLNGATSQGVYFASLDYDNDGVLDFLDNCPSTFNTVQHDSDEDGPGNPCDNCPSAGNTSQQNSDADSFGNACDNCPTVTNQDQANLDGDPLGDVCDLDDDADKVFDVDEGPCGGDSLNAAKKPERLDTPGVDDDLDGMFNEGLPSPASDGFDCDGDGWKGNQENLIFAAGTTANDQDPCGNNGWAADLTGTNNTLNIADIASFLTPARSNDGHGTFNKFGHPLDDTPPVGIDAVMARWNLSLPPHDPATQINIADLNALIAGAAGSPARPPMFNGQIAFFTSGGMCPYLP